MSYDFLPCLSCGSMDHYLDYCEDEKALARYYKDEEDNYPLHSADPKCEHVIELLWSGYKCTKCPGWFCA